MWKRRKKNDVPQREMTPEEALDSFELKKPEPVYDENGKRDYFTEYYQAYKNEYIDQYLDAYKRFKSEGAIPDTTPVDVKLDEPTPQADAEEEMPVTVKAEEA